MQTTARRLVLSAAALAILGVANDARAQFTVPTGTQQIQEDWVCVVATPNPTQDGPQIQTYMSSVSDSSLPYAWFMLNSRDNPYAGGGMQAQIWTYSDSLITSTSFGTAKLNTANETITWTQALQVAGGGPGNPFYLAYSVFNGNSTTWGTFGSSTYQLTYASGQVTGTAMNTYNPSVSISKSRVGWQPNSVSKLGITQIRCYDAKGKLLLTDTTWRPVSLATQ